MLVFKRKFYIEFLIKIMYLITHCVSDQKPPQSVPSATVPDRDPERVEHGQGPETDPGRAPVDSGPKGPSEGIN